MSKPRPVTPPSIPSCIPFGIQRFNRICAKTRTGQGYCNIRPVRVFSEDNRADSDALFCFPVLSAPLGIGAELGLVNQEGRGKHREVIGIPHNGDVIGNEILALE